MPAIREFRIGLGLSLAIASFLQPMPAAAKVKPSPNDIAICRNEETPYSAEQAAEACDRVLSDRTAPRDVRALAHAYLARSYAEAKYYEGARQELDIAAALAVNPTIKDEVALIGRSFPSDIELCDNAQGKFDEEWVIGGCDRVIARKTSTRDTKARAYLGKARQWLRWDDFEAARPELKAAEALATSPEVKAEIKKMWKRIPGER